MIQTLPFSIPSLHAAYARGVPATDIAREIFRRIEAVDDPGIFICLRGLDEVLADAAALPEFHPACQPLWGIPFVIKDNIDAGGMATTAGCPAFAYIPHRDAFVVAELKRAGALLIGKTNLDQFATGLVGVRSPYPPPKNALDPEIVPGGSSSGSAVAVAHGIVSFSLGTDTAGSGRVPAALNNIVGLKPTLGALSNQGVVPACRTLDTISIFARNVSDAFSVLQTCTVFDNDDAYAKPVVIDAPPTPLPRLRIGVPDAATRLFFGDDQQAAMFAAAIELMTSNGHQIHELDFTAFFDIANMLYEGAWVAERYTVTEDLLKSQPDAIHPTTRSIIQAAEKLSAADAFRGIYRLAELRRTAKPLMASIDALMVPTIPTFYTLDDLAKDPIGPNSKLGTYTNFVNLIDLCGIAVPTHARSDGKPGSVTLLAPSSQDHLIAALAREIECSQGTIDIVAVGAHMRGLALNHELTSRGARFVKEAKTSASYRLYSLKGGPPKRPGLVREPAGAMIDLEIWSMPKHALGSFMAGIPSPLGIGTIELNDGGMVKGFLCEQAGLEGAEDITRFGGWRAYLKGL